MTTNKQTDALYPSYSATYGWCVRDPAGGVWWPNDDAKREIDVIDVDGYVCRGVDEAADAALRMCRETPERGKWSQ
jgi:hypothetical protein